MFGNAPKALWTRWFQADEANRIELACRCLLVREQGSEGGRWVLLETGIGAFFEPAMRERFGVIEEGHVLVDELQRLGVKPSDIDVVVLSHLHFDHAGGMLNAWQADGEPELIFDRARYVVGQRAWDRACDPHPRDRASFIPVLQSLLEASGRLELVADGEWSDVLGEDWSFHVSDGHTPGMLLAECRSSSTGRPLLFAADLIPGRPWLRRAITMGYDRYPELLIDEKARILESLQAEDGCVFFTHDPGCAMASLALDERGRCYASTEHGVLEALEH